LDALTSALRNYAKAAHKEEPLELTPTDLSQWKPIYLPLNIYDIKDYDSKAFD